MRREHGVERLTFQKHTTIPFVLWTSHWSSRSPLAPPPLRATYGRKAAVFSAGSRLPAQRQCMSPRPLVHSVSILELVEGG